MAISIKPCVWFVALTSLIGCVGVTPVEPGELGGADSGGAAASGGATQAAGGGGSTLIPSSGGGTGNPTVCCLALAVCKAGDEQISGPDACPAGASCYSNSICCSTVWCISNATQCTAVPVCEPGDIEIKGECPANGSCYSRSVCGATIQCQTVQPGCDPATEYNRNYVATREQCKYVRFGCLPNTTYFANDCGCGCEQPSSCPQSVDCEPGGAAQASPLCTDSSTCPYTIRAL